jgi:hypothetical protein
VKLSEDKLALLDNAIKDFRIAIKNSILYQSDHSICSYSTNNFKLTLDKWFKISDHLDLGIAQTHLFYEGESIGKEDDLYGELARFLHMRGMIALSFSAGLDIEELRKFFDVLKKDRKWIQEKGGLKKNLPELPHIVIKEIDYRSLLKGANDQGASEEGKIWQFLFNIAQESKSGDLPKNKVDFLVDFFKDTKQSVRTLNKVYRDGASQLVDENAADSVREVIKQICQFLEKNKTKDGKDLKVQLMHVISQLHPDLINKLFEQTVGDEQDFDLVESITKDFSEDYIAEFIESLISSEDTFNENLLKVFDKLTPGESKANSVVSMVADKLFNKRILNPETMTQMQMSIMEIFKRHPDSDFMNQIYKITVDSVMNKRIDTLVYMARLSPLINKFVQSMEDEQLKKEKIWLLLNILWLENNPVEFKKFTEKLFTILPELLDTKDTARLREIAEFFSEKIRPEQRHDRQMAVVIRETLARIAGRKTADSLVALIPEAGQKELEDIVYVLSRSDGECIKVLVDAFLGDKVPVHRNKFLSVFMMMKGEIAREAVGRLEYAEAMHVKDLFWILRECDPAKAHLAAKKCISHSDAQVRWEALDVFDPQTEEERHGILRILKKEKNRSVSKKAMAVILKTGDAAVVDRLFKHVERGLQRRKNLPELVELCGHLRAKHTFPHLQRIFLKRGLLPSKHREALRVAILTGVARMKTEEAVQLIRSGLHDRNRKVRDMSEIILKLDE